MNIGLRSAAQGESGGHCDCCGNETRTVWGNVYAEDQMIACYFVSWTRRNPDHYPNIDLLIGAWGNEAIHDRRLVAWLYNPASPSFMVIDSESRPAASSSLCAKALSREEALADESLMEVARSTLDAIWSCDERIVEVQRLSDDT